MSTPMAASGAAAFDYETTSSDPPSIPDYNAISSIDSQNVIRLVCEQLQTNGLGGSKTLRTGPLTDAFRPRGANSFADLYSDLSFKPRSCSFRFPIRYEITRRLRMALHIYPSAKRNLELELVIFYLRTIQRLPTALAKAADDPSSFFCRS